MTIKITPFEVAFPGSQLNSSRMISARFANNAVQFMRVCAAAVETRDIFGFNFNVELPLFHQAIELLLKAHAIYYDSTFNPRKYNHRSSSIITDYYQRIPAFAEIQSNQDKMNLIKGLEQAWLSLRYGDATLEADGSDWDLAGEIANNLCDHYFSLTGTPLQQHHFDEIRRKKK